MMTIEKRQGEETIANAIALDILNSKKTDDEKTD